MVRAGPALAADGGLGARGADGADVALRASGADTALGVFGPLGVEAELRAAGDGPAGVGAALRAGGVDGTLAAGGALRAGRVGGVGGVGGVGVVGAVGAVGGVGGGLPADGVRGADSREASAAGEAGLRASGRAREADGSALGGGGVGAERAGAGGEDRGTLGGEVAGAAGGCGDRSLGSVWALGRAGLDAVGAGPALAEGGVLGVAGAAERASRFGCLGSLLLGV